MLAGLSEASDIHLCVDDLRRSLAFPGPMLAMEIDPNGVLALAQRADAVQRSDFLLQHGDCFFRGRRDTQAVDGNWVRLRRIPPVAPSLDTLPSPLPSAVRAMLLSPLLATGGLVYVIGAPASGKTTTASAIVKSRLEAFGGMCYTLEDPPEMPLNGWHGPGYCSQTWVAGDTAEGWAEGFRGALRSQPAGSALMMYVGEVRDAQSAQALVRAAANGFLVVATGFGTDIATGIDSLLRLAGVDHDITATFASLLRIVLHQRIVNGSVRASFLASPNGHSAVANKIRHGEISHLGTELAFQATEAAHGGHAFMKDFHS